MGRAFYPPPLSLSLSLSLHKLEFLNWPGQDLLQRAVRSLKRCTSGSACSWHGHCCTCYGPWPFVLWTLLSCVRSDTPAFPFFLLLSWVCLYWFSCVKRRRYSGSTTYKIQPRRHEGVRQTWRALQLIARLCETCMHRTSTLVLGIGLAFARSNSWKGFLGVFALPKSLPSHRSCHSQRLFFQDAP